MNNEIITKLKSKICLIIEKRGITKYELAKCADISDPCIRNWFSERQYTPSLQSLINICDVLGITLAELFAEGEFYPIEGELKEFIEIWQILSKEERNLLLNFLKGFKKL